MRLYDIDRYFRDVIAIDELSAIDDSDNGIQVGRPSADISRVAFAVDACMESFRRAASWNADLIFVHHGLFWGRSVMITGGHYERLKFLIDNDLALFAAHLPLDRHLDIGNNAVMANKLHLSDVEPFGEYHGVKIGVKGLLPRELSIDAILESLSLDRDSCNAVLPFGKSEIRSVGIVSGGATRETEQAIREKLDLYITGDAAHEVYHLCLEERINLICGGHYRTEIWGVSTLAEKLKQDTGLDACFIDIPTGL
ncbi:MAG: Nif3-like dinuclear metal center hexameric protein [Spirochaetales bacterium]|nr:Nif3-like dinuclear metal center hexameric protein [Spirochaetales bacterium]